MKRLSYLFSLLLFVSVNVLAQEDGGENTGNNEAEATTAAPAEVQALRAEDNGGYNPLSRRPVHLSDQMYRKTIWRALDLREKQNKPFFSNGRELSRIIMDAVKQGKLTPYLSDSVNRPMPVDEFDKRCMVPGQDMEEDDGFGADAWDDGGGDDGGWGDEGGEEEVEISPYYLENTLYTFEIMEDMIFDKQRSRMYYDILSIGMFVPADNPDNVKGIQESIAFFRYVDLLEVFEEDPRAFWYNPQNDAAHRNLGDAFDLRLFSSYIIRVSNPDDAYLVDIYGTPEKGIVASYKTMYELLEYEHNLWEY